MGAALRSVLRTFACFTLSASYGPGRGGRGIAARESGPITTRIGARNRAARPHSPRSTVIGETRPGPLFGAHASQASGAAESAGIFYGSDIALARGPAGPGVFVAAPALLSPQWPAVSRKLCCGSDIALARGEADLVEPGSGSGFSLTRGVPGSEGDCCRVQALLLGDGLRHWAQGGGGLGQLLLSRPPKLGGLRGPGGGRSGWLPGR